MASAEPLNDLQLNVNEVNYDNHYPLFKGIIHGVLHLLSAKDMKQLDDFEGKNYLYLLLFVKLLYCFTLLLLIPLFRPLLLSLF